MNAVQARAKVRAAMPGIRADLERLVRVPSVSAPGFEEEPLRHSADVVADLLRRSGVDARVITAAGGHPAVVGRVAGPKGTPTVLLYAHHDVQPTGPRDLWLTDPFAPVERDGRLYGRGAADDKAGVLAHAAALRAWDGKPPVGVAFFIEGEEEAGSKHLPEYLERERELLRCDAVVLADSSNWRVGQPALTVSLRGGVTCVVEVRTLDHAVHSGMYGGPIPDAIVALARLIATLHDERGRVAVPGLVRGDADALDLGEAEVRAWTGARPSVRLIGEGTLTSRLWRQPTIDVTGVDAPSVKDATNQLVPSARAKISMRIAPGQDPEQARAALLEHLRRNAPWGAEVSFPLAEFNRPFEVRTSGRAYRAMRDALRDAWGVEPRDVGTGGSIPFLFDFERTFPGAEFLITGVEDPSSNAHSENESLHLGEFENACVAETLFLDLLARR